MMELTKKMILVDPARTVVTNPTSHVTERFKDPRKRFLHTLDQSMMDVIDRVDLSDTEKVDLYNRTLTEYQSNNSSTIPNKPPTRGSSDGSEAKELIGIPQTYRGKAKDLLSLLRGEDNINWTENGIVSIKGETIPSSNITDLVRRAVSPRNLITLENLNGWDIFESFLRQDVNIPRSIVSLNNAGTSVINQMRNTGRRESIGTVKKRKPTVKTTRLTKKRVAGSPKTNRWSTF